MLSIGITGIILYVKDPENTLLITLTICAFPAFLTGLTEDLMKNVRPATRLLFIASSAVSAGVFLNAWLTSLALPFVDYLMTFGAISVFFTCFAVTGVVNSFNLIDGLNGLASLVAIIILLSLAFVAHKVDDPIITNITLIFSAAISGFFIWNYPFGKIFLGDGGAYLIGFLVAELSILLVIRNPEVSIWFPFVLVFYPIFETIHTIYRRFFVIKISLVVPDTKHLHQLINRKLVALSSTGKPVEKLTNNKNSITSPFLWGIASCCAIPAIIFYDNTAALQIIVIMFLFIFYILYFLIRDRE